MVPKKKNINSRSAARNQPSRGNITNQSGHRASGNMNASARTGTTSQSQSTTRNASNTTSQGQQNASIRVHSKHKAVTKKGTKFDWTDNTRINLAALKKEELEKMEPAKLQLTLKDTKGKQHTFPYHGRVDLTNSNSIKRFNAWRNQILYRRFHDKDGLWKRRPLWTKQEKNFLIGNLRDRLKQCNGKLSDEDWKALTDLQNVKFKGKKREAGVTMTPSVYRHKKVVFKDGRVTKTEGTFGERNPDSIKAMIFKWPDTKSIFDFYSTNENDGESQEESNEESDGEKDNASDVDHHLEDPSDDEEDGMMPAANPTGGNPIPA